MPIFNFKESREVDVEAEERPKEILVRYPRMNKRAIKNVFERAVIRAIEIIGIV